jgi:protein gp37
MSENSKIEWTDHTFNPWIGCTKVSPGCAHCYAETRDKRHLIEKVDHWGKGAPRLRTSAANWRKPAQWNAVASSFRECTRCGHRAHMHEGCMLCGCDTAPTRQRVFCASQADWLDAEVAIDWLADLLALIHATPQLDWLLLTKRPENWLPRIEQVFERMNVDLDFYEAHRGCSELVDRWFGEPPYQRAPANVWLGATVEDQKRGDERIPLLMSIPARVRFLSCEPLLGPVDVPASIKKGLFYKADGTNNSVSAPGVPVLNWVICGGESGPGARAFHIAWADSLLAQCQAAGVPFFMKQLGAKPCCQHSWDGDQSSNCTACFPDPIRDHKGGDADEWPAALRVREFPLPSTTAKR